MALPSSGAISFSQIQTEFGGTNPISLSEYYNTTSGIGLGISSQYSIPASGAIAMSNFYGAQKFNFYETTTFVTSASVSGGNQSVSVSSTSSMKDRWMIVCFGGWNADVPFNINPTINFTTGATGSATVTAVNTYSYPADDGYSDGIAYRKIADGATSVTVAYTNPNYQTGGGYTGDGTYVPVSNNYGSINAAVYVVSGVPTLTHYGLQSSGTLNNGTGSITLNATSTKSFAIFVAWRNRTPFTITNATYYSESGYKLNPSVGNTTYTTIMKGRFHGILFNY
jgi:hypothetical protein